ncbi:MAG: TIGR04141 family sporadically distributed protein [Candidatus Thiodiazotropha sp. (ex Lucinoma borealis)]|nr:TIGR04141 family sporadically distributed protein [Candidatus Thiodiazotropha sp. (ex Lucinoma borealis)]
MSSEPKTQHLTIFLAQEIVADIAMLVKDGSYTKHIELSLPKLGLAHLYIKIGARVSPPWVSIFDGIVSPDDVGKSNGISAVLIVRTSGRLFALTFGQGGRFLISESSIESRFGLIVTLNSVNSESLRCIDKQSLDNLESQSRIQSAYETTPDQFGIDIEQDMLKAIVGSPVQSSLGSRMTGTDSLSVSVKATVHNLKDLLDAYLTKFQIDLSKKGYEWVNNISNIKQSSSIIGALEQQLDTKLKTKDFSNIWLSIPEIIPWEMVKGFVFTHGRKLIHPDITMDGFLTTVKDKNIDIELLKQRKVSCADENHKNIFRTWPVYRCLYAEIDYDGSTYVLNDGKWFRIEPDFVKKTNIAYAQIPMSKLTLPVYQHNAEGEYNQDVAHQHPTKYALLDDKQKVFHGGGKGQVEICDLFGLDKNLIHIKRYGKSSVLSHLFSQGFVSGQLLQLDTEFRAKMKDKLPPSFKSLINVGARPLEKEFTVTFAVISEDQGMDLHLPFFSRVNINNTYRILKGYGYKVELLKILVDPTYAKTKKYPPEKVKKK